VTIIRFTDGVNIDTAGPLRPLCLADGWYVVGEGCSIPVKDRAEALQIIADLTNRTKCPR
jgi:hypothetical protein